MCKRLTCIHTRLDSDQAVVSDSSQEDDKHLVLTFQDEELDDNRSTVRDCGIASGDTLVMRDNGGITFKMLSREHARRAKIKEQEDAGRVGGGVEVKMEAEEHAQEHAEE